MGLPGLGALYYLMRCIMICFESDDEYEEEQEAPRQLESVNSVQHELDNQAMTIDQPLDAPPPYPTQLNSVQHGLDKSSNEPLLVCRLDFIEPCVTRKRHK